MSGYVFAVEGLDDLRDVADLNDDILTAAYRAINSATDRGRANAARDMRRQVNFPARYLSGSGNRLTVTKKASKSSLEAIITGRQRPTSLARFSVGSGNGEVSVSVKPGRVKSIKRAFLMTLRSGNIGLATRFAKGRRPEAAYRPVKIAEGLYLLYGPSVDQVFKTVREDVSPGVLDHLEREFLRLVDLKL